MNLLQYYFLIFLFIIQNCQNTNYILPFHSINIISNESIIKQDYLSKIYSSHLYANFLIGSNREEIKAVINMSQLGFFIYENAYNYNSSTSFCQSFNIKSFYKKNYEEGYLANDTLCFIPQNENNDINNLNVRKCNNFEKVNFSLLKSVQKKIPNNIYENYGIIGLEQYSNQDELTMTIFIKSLKNTDMINSHKFSFNFLKNTKNNENEGYILIGDEEFDEDNGFIKRAKAMPINGQIFWNLAFTNVISGVYNNFNNSYENYLRNFDTKYAQIIGNLPYIVGIKDYKNYIRANFFQSLLDKNICFYKNIFIDEDYGTFVCDNSSDLFREKYNNNFPKLYFTHSEFNKTFILDQFDLFTSNNLDKSDKNLYFLVLFPNKDDPYRNPEFPGGMIVKRWKLGIPFLKKYKLTFDNDENTIIYYNKFNRNKDVNENEDNESPNNPDKAKKENNSSNTSNKNTLIKIIIIGGLLFIFFVLGILFHKNIIRLPRKKKANELEDDYEYTINPNTLDEKKASLNNYEISN